MCSFANCARRSIALHPRTPSFTRATASATSSRRSRSSGDDGSTPRATLAEIRTRVEALIERQAALWDRELVPALAAEGIVVAAVADLTPDERAELGARFEQEVYPVLTPLAVGPGQPFPYISALSVSLAVFVRDPDSGEERLARVKVPEGLPRFMEVGDRGLFVPLEDVIAHSLGSLFPQMEVSQPTV